MTTSTLIYVDGMPTVIFDHGPRSRWADAWRAVRSDEFGFLLGSPNPLIDEAYAAYDARCREERRVAAVAECCFNLKEWLLAKRAARKWVPVAACFTKREFNEACETPF